MRQERGLSRSADSPLDLLIFYLGFLLLEIWINIPILRKFLLHPVCFGADKADATHKFMHSPQA